MAEPLPRASGVPAWIRYGLISGAFAFAVTLAANLVFLVARPADLCRVGPIMLPLSGLVALIAFAFFAASAGFATGRATGMVAQAALSGLVVGVVGGCAVLAALPFTEAMQQRFEQLSAVCPPTSGFGGGYSFQLGTTPPAFIQGTPPPGVVPPTPPPGFTLSPAGGTGSISFSGSMETVLRMIGLVVTVGVGMGFATGVAALTGLIGASMRSRRSNS
jgi:hypothetical protein